MEPVKSVGGAASQRPREARTTSAPYCARFSRGIERLPDTAAKRRVGRFCDGIARPIAPQSELPVGRFSVGIERKRPRTLRQGSFANGYEQISRR
jgi:hypothetical protein